ncbi:MAG TPA: hypothetical protein VHO68_03815, partial [Bacteroidales bacterium]|nr:hypothetical protein [Bacteroidales bacterium]
FRTSMFSTFMQKLESVSDWENMTRIDDEANIKTLMRLLSLKGTISETFDKYELEGAPNGTRPLIQCEALMNPWMSLYADNLVYDVCRTTDLSLSRDITILGLLPVKAVIVFNRNAVNYLLNGQPPESTAGNVYFRYDVGMRVGLDYYELLQKAAARYLNSDIIPPQPVTRLLTTRLDNLSHGPYPFRTGYVLPGSGSFISSKDYVFTY